jgi:hypothetical protein
MKMKTKKTHPSKRRLGKLLHITSRKVRKSLHDCPADELYQHSNRKLVEELFESSAKKHDPNRLYDDFFLTKLDSLRRDICQIDAELEARKMIHNQLVQEFDSQILSASIFLDHIKHWGIGYRTGIDIERNFWEKRIADLTKEKRTEKLKIWKDGLALKEQRREIEKGYEELLKRMNWLK